MSDCAGACASCGEACDKREFMAEENPFSSVKNVFGVVSGKGGVGKSITTGIIASLLARKGYKVAVMDADITGPSIPKMFGISAKASGDDQGINPVETASGIKIMSINLLLEDETSPVVWRGPVIAGVIKQFWSEVKWGDVDVMLIDMPPGTGDVPLTAFQSLPLKGIFVVTTPQDLVSMIVQKACQMAQMMNIPVLGLIENMSYILCPDCEKRIDLFSGKGTEEIAKKMRLPLLAQMPMDPHLAKLCDEGEIERVNRPYMDAVINELETKYIK